MIWISSRTSVLPRRGAVALCATEFLAQRRERESYKQEPLPVLPRPVYSLSTRYHNDKQIDHSVN